MSLINNNIQSSYSDGCGCGGSTTGHCVCDTLAAVLAEQQKVAPIEQQDCTTGCHISLVSPATNLRGDTIPLILMNKEGQPQTAFGKLGQGESKCFITVFFKVVALDTDNHCATLQLLEPDKKLDGGSSCCVPLGDICKVTNLTRTTECITVDCKCFCSIQCLEPQLVDPAVAN